MELHPEILHKHGKAEFAVLPYEEYVAIEAVLADAEDLIDLRAAKGLENGIPGLTLEEAKKTLGI